MKRYTVNFGANYGMFVDEHGEWVTFSDHEAEIARVRAERDAAVAALTRIADPREFITDDPDASLAREYEEIAQAVLDARKEEK